jgi:hypothetical protein
VNRLIRAPTPNSPNAVRTTVISNAV